MGALREVLSIPKQLPNQGSLPSRRWAPGLCTCWVAFTCPHRSAWGAGQATLGSPVPCSPAPGQRPQRSGCISGTGQVGGDAAAHFVHLARTGQEGTWHCPTPEPVIHPRDMDGSRRDNGPVGCRAYMRAGAWGAGPGVQGTGAHGDHTWSPRRRCCVWGGAQGRQWLSARSGRGGVPPGGFLGAVGKGEQPGGAPGAAGWEEHLGRELKPPGPDLRLPSCRPCAPAMRRQACQPAHHHLTPHSKPCPSRLSWAERPPTCPCRGPWGPVLFLHMPCSLLSFPRLTSLHFWVSDGPNHLLARMPTVGISGNQDS